MEFAALSRVLLQKIGMEQSKADPYVFRKVVDGEVILIVYVHVDDLAVTAKDKKTFDVFHAQSKDEFPVNDMGDLCRYLGCAFERDKMEGRYENDADSLVCRFVGWPF